jgi:hypothetical protein
LAVKNSFAASLKPKSFYLTIEDAAKALFLANVNQVFLNFVIKN